MSSLGIAICLLTVVQVTPPAFPPPKQAGIYVIAHRGAHRGIPENTLAAYRKAIELGADFVEIDLRTTRDGQFVSIHNSSIDAYVRDGSRAMVRDLTLAQLKKLDIGSRVGAAWKDERVPTLEEILTVCRGQIGIYLDLKAGSIPAIVDRIRNFEMQHQVVWCIQPAQVPLLRRACPECIPMPDPESEATLPTLLRQTTPRVVAPVWSDFSPTFAEPCHRAGALVFVDEREPDIDNWRQAVDWGADGIQTDAPAELLRFLKQVRPAANPGE